MSNDGSIPTNPSPSKPAPEPVSDESARSVKPDFVRHESRREAIPERLLNRYSHTDPNPVLKRMARLAVPLMKSFEIGAMREGRDPRFLDGLKDRIIRDGRMIEVPMRPPKGGVAASEGTQATTDLKNILQAAVGGVVGEEISLFEKIFLAHFEGGAPVEASLEAGQSAKFLPKTQKGWMEFFQKFMAFTLLKTGDVREIRSLIIRGLMTPSGELTAEGRALLEGAPMILISDLVFADGTTDKFARLKLQSAEMAELFSKMSPGDALSGEALEALTAALGADALEYLGLSHKIVDKDAAKSPATEAYQSPFEAKDQAIRDGVREVKLGIALSAKTEQIIAERLDINLRPGVAPVTRSEPGGEMGLSGLLFPKKRRRGWFGDDGLSSDAHVPWYAQFFKAKQFPDKPRWWVPFLYFGIGSAIALAVFSLVRSLTS